MEFSVKDSIPALCEQFSLYFVIAVHGNDGVMDFDFVSTGNSGGSASPKNSA